MIISTCSAKEATKKEESSSSSERMNGYSATPVIGRVPKKEREKKSFWSIRTKAKELARSD
jgi:hypothetical protein